MTADILTALENLPPLLRPAETAQVLRTTENSLNQDRYLGRGVPYIRSGRRILYARDDVLDYLRKNTVQPGDGPQPPASAATTKTQIAPRPVSRD